MTQRPEHLEAELHAFVDDELADGRRAAVIGWLAEHPEDAARVAAWQAQNEAIRHHFGPIAEEPLPARLCFEELRRRRRGRWLRAAAAVLCLAVGGGAGWLANDLFGTAGRPDDRLADRAIAAHRVFAVEVRHPVEVAAEQEQHLVTWLSKRLGHDLRVPDLSAAGFRLMGGRLLPSDDGSAAQFMFEDADNRRITLYVARNPSNREAAFQFHAAAGANAFYWLDGPIGYAIIGDVDREALLQLAHLVYRQLEP